MLQKLWTARGGELRDHPETQPWNVYPRPQMKRDSWMNLNGWWDFAVSEAEKLPKEYTKTIRVPFCPESMLSGIEKHYPEGAYLYYRRNLILPQGFNRGRVLLHIGAADQIADVFVNGKHLCHHEGGYDAFSCDITDALEEQNELVICCVDNLRDHSFPYGKQVMERGGMWYTPVSGIWQSVWVESVPENYIESLHIENRGYSVTVDIGKDMPGTVTVRDLGTYELAGGKATIAPENPNLWSPENPYLYEFTLEAGEDKVESYFAVRSLEIKTVGRYPRLCLNGKPYYFHGLLDQGYWPEGLLTAPTPESYADDIQAMKKLGYNTLRKHIKVEPEEFYYQCDKLGMIVWQDMVNNGDYNYNRDTLIPTIGFQTLPDKHMHKDQLGRSRFFMAMIREVMQLRSHPSIFYWTIFNEGWGQFDSDYVYEEFKKLDDTRFVNSTSGWFRQKKSDVEGRHMYFYPGKMNLKGNGRQPLVLSEFGGKAYGAAGHVFNPDKVYGYGSTCENLQELDIAVTSLYMGEVLPCVKNGLCASIYTQVSDVEDEINGLLTYDRFLEKLTPEIMLPIAKALQAALEEETACAAK